MFQAKQADKQSSLEIGARFERAVKAAMDRMLRRVLLGTSVIVFLAAVLVRT